MTVRKPAEFLPRMREIFAECGIAFVLLPHLKNSGVNGAVKWVSEDRVVLAMNNRGLDADKFWFSLFHELGHILLGHINQSNGTTIEDENAADNFAKETLIPTAEFNAFTSLNDFSKASIYSFAQEQNILCGIVVGRLQKEGFINYNRCNDLKTKYALSV